MPSATSSMAWVQPSPLRPFRCQRRLAGDTGDGTLARWTARIGLGEQVVTTKTLRRRFFSLAGRLTRSARRLTALAPTLALGGPVQSRLDAIARPAAPRLTVALLTAAPATGLPRSPSSTSQSKVSPTRAARIGQREFLAASGHLMSGSPHRQQARCWPCPPEIRRVDPVSIPGRSLSSATTTRFGGFGLRPWSTSTWWGPAPISQW